MGAWQVKKSLGRGLGFLQEDWTHGSWDYLN